MSWLKFIYVKVGTLHCFIYYCMRIFNPYGYIPNRWWYQNTTWKCIYFHPICVCEANAFSIEPTCDYCMCVYSLMLNKSNSPATQRLRLYNVLKSGTNLCVCLYAWKTDLMLVRSYVILLHTKYTKAFHILICIICSMFICIQ